MVLSTNQQQIKTIKEIYNDYKTNPDKLPKFKNTLKKNIVFSDPYSGRVFLKLFIFNDKLTEHGWRGNKEQIPKNLKMNLGHPLAVAADSNYLMFAHPGSTKLSYSINENIQKPFIIGQAISTDDKPDSNGDYYSVYDITNSDAKQFFSEIASNEQIPIPMWSSPQIAFSNKEDETNIQTFKIQHNILTDTPAFGKDAAVAKALCTGDTAQCMPVLQQASVNSFSFDDNYNNIKCPFCIVGRLTQIFDNNVKTVQASLNNYNSSHVSENNSSNIMSSNETQAVDATTNTTSSTLTPQENVTITSRQPVNTNDNINNNNQQEQQNKAPTAEQIDFSKINQLIEEAIEKKFGEKSKEQQGTKTEDNNKDNKKEDKKSTKIDYSQLDDETRTKLEKFDKIEKQNKELSDRVYRDDVGNLLLEYYKENKAFIDEKGSLDETRFKKVLEYWTKQSKPIDDIKETIEMVSLMYAPNQNKKEAEQLITKKASINEFQLYDVPKTQESEVATKSNNTTDSKPYWDRDIVHKSI